MHPDPPVVDTIIPALAAQTNDLSQNQLGTQALQCDGVSEDQSSQDEKQGADDLPAVTVTDLGDQLWRRRRTDPKPPSQDYTPGPLQHALSGKFVRSDIRSQEFLPNRELPQVVNRRTVQAELAKWHKSRIFKPIKASRKVLSTEARKICGNGGQSWRLHPEAVEGSLPSPRPRVSETSYRKIFAILVLIERPSRIKYFVEEGVCDADLPLERYPTPHLPFNPWELRRKSKITDSLRCFKLGGVRWRHVTVRRFEETQWQFLAPFLSPDERRLPHHFKIPERTILPFTKWEKLPSTGGFGQVYKAEIHPDHHAFHDPDDANHSVLSQQHVFAVKELRSKNEQDFRREFEALRIVSKQQHDHLISLLASYEQQGYYHFIFPFADADLYKYWKEHEPIRDSTTALWLADQCEGLARGLATIHRYHTFSAKKLLSAAVPAPNGELRLTVPKSSLLVAKPSWSQLPRLVCCRHGDIKPENILWFPDPVKGSSRGMGVLKITDFGTAEVTETDETPWKKAPNSLMYCPPEVEVPRDDLLRNSYDIWGLGCVFLEFAAWYFGGWKGVEEFLDERLQVNNSFHQFRTGTFFYVEEEGGVRRALIKPGVHQFIKKLRSEQECRSFFRGFLDMIKDEMLVVESESGVGRKSAANVAAKVVELRKGDEILREDSQGRSP